MLAFLSLWVALVCIFSHLTNAQDDDAEKQCVGDVHHPNATGTVLWSDDFIAGNNRVTFYRGDPGFGTSFVLNATTAGNNTYGKGYNVTYSINVKDDRQTGYNNETYPTLSTTIAFGTPPGVDFYQGNSAWSACAVVLSGIPLNTLKRGQKDDGSCNQMFSPECVKALTSKMSDFAYYQTAHFETFGPLTNLSVANPVALVCDNIAANVGQVPIKGQKLDGVNYLPDECVPYFEGGRNDFGPSMIGIPLTSNSTPTSGCSLQQWPGVLPNYTVRAISTSYQNYSYSSGGPANANFDNNLYDNATRTMYPIISVFFPQANSSRTSTWSYASGHMTCPRVTRFGTNSRKAPALGTPTPVAIPGKGLSKGAKAGIGVGVSLGVILIIALVAFGILRQRKRARGRRLAAEEEAAARESERGTELPGQNGTAAAAQEKYGWEKKPPLETDGNVVHEAPGDYRPAELDGEHVGAGGRERSRSPAELQG